MPLLERVFIEKENSYTQRTLIYLIELLDDGYFLKVISRGAADGESEGGKTVRENTRR